MIEYDLSDALDRVRNLVQSVDRTDNDALFNCLAEVELLSRNSLADHSVTELLKAGMSVENIESEAQKAA